MPAPAPAPNSVQRSFRDLSEDLGQETRRYRNARTGVFGWEELLKSQRILIVSEAGTGKTFECKAQRDALWAAGEPAFFVELAQLSRSPLRNLLDLEEEERFTAWLTSQTDRVTIFLDSIDELKLTLGSFELALKQLSKALAGQLGRARIVITTRPIPFEHQIIRRLLAIPEPAPAPTGAAAFADLVTSNGRPSSNQEKGDAPPAWRTVALMPLSDDQIRVVAAGEGIIDADALLQDIHKRKAQEFASRPQDLIELCADWREHRRIRRHREQVANNISVKLKPREDEREKAPLSEDRAMEGASRLALAALLTRRLTIRHSAEADRSGEPGTALDPAAILSDWAANERQTLLERPLFGPAGMGRVRFHHRSVIEYLAAHRVAHLLANGMSQKAAKRLLFAETPQRQKVVRPTMRPVAAWLAAGHPAIFEEVCAREPGVLFDHADPESLTPPQRARVLQDYVERYGRGGWRGMHVADIQVHRFATPDLAGQIVSLWHNGIENLEVRQLLLELVAAVPLREGADIAFSVAMRSDADDAERIAAIEVLVKLADPRLDQVTESMDNDPGTWPETLVKMALPTLFPAHLEVEQLCRILSRELNVKRAVDSLSWRWLPLIENSEMTTGYLDALRTGLTALVAQGATWDREWPHAKSPRPYLCEPLAVACVRQLKEAAFSRELAHSIVVAIRLGRDEYGHNAAGDRLRELLAPLPARDREGLFWADDAFAESLNPQDEPWRRVYEVHHEGAIQLNARQDAAWLLAGLADTQRPQAERTVALEAVMQSARDEQGERHEFLRGLGPLVADDPVLVDRLAKSLEPRPVSEDLVRMQARQQEQAQEAQTRRQAQHANWMTFWQRIADTPQTVFGAEQSEQTVFNLWQAMARSGDESRASGWNRRFIERYFSKDVADRMRLAMKPIWRNGRPTLRSERPDDRKAEYERRWQIGLSGIAAEAEDPDWAQALSVQEAELAARYAPLAINGFPSWLESLAQAHPNAVDAVLGAELTAELHELAMPKWYPVLLQDLESASRPLVALFLPRLLAWLQGDGHRVRDGENEHTAADRLQRVSNLLLAHGTDSVREAVQDIAGRELQGAPAVGVAQVWLAIVMQLAPEAGVNQLEQILQPHAPAHLGPGVDWIGYLFAGRSRKAAVDLGATDFAPGALLRLVRLAYQHVRPQDDIQHDGAYSPGPRDHAEEARSALMNALLEARGQAGWEAKLEMAADPLFSHFRDRALALALEKAAMEADGAMLTEEQARAFDRAHEIAATTRDEMFAVLADRLDDLDEYLLRDFSPREMWAGITDERVMRRAIAAELDRSANDLYIVDQEGATADEKETDIRLRAKLSEQQAVIELKLGDGRPGRDLRDTLSQQLVKKYMASEITRSGCLLVTVSKDRTWDHPDTGKSLDIVGLEEMLKAEASRIEQEMGMSLRLTVKVLNLRPRLQTERRKAKSE